MLLSSCKRKAAEPLSPATFCFKYCMMQQLQVTCARRWDVHHRHRRWDVHHRRRWDVLHRHALALREKRCRAKLMYESLLHDLHWDAHRLNDKPLRYREPDHRHWSVFPRRRVHNCCDWPWRRRRHDSFRRHRC
jgi:hypothetical protein